MLSALGQCHMIIDVCLKGHGVIASALLCAPGVNRRAIKTLRAVMARLCAPLRVEGKSTDVAISAPQIP